MNHDCDPIGCCGTVWHRPPTTFADVLVALESVSEQIKVLVSAVDDLRCEVEWQGRDADRESAPISPLPVDDRAGESLLSAAGRLSAYEKCLRAAPRGLWLDKWTSDLDELDTVEFPYGRVFSVSADIWDALWSVRHAHVVDGRERCDCEDSSQPGPYLMAWRTEHEFLFRELSSEEARRLQQLCLESQAEQARAAIERAADAPLQSQLGLF